MSDKWLVVPYGNAVVDGKPESEWGWMVNRDDDTECIEVESKARAEQIAAFLNGTDVCGARADCFWVEAFKPAADNADSKEAKP